MATTTKPIALDETLQRVADALENRNADIERYAFNSVTPTTSGTTASVTLADRAINDLSLASGITALDITPPDAVTGKARDFFARVTVADSSGPATVTFGSGQTIDIGSTELAAMTSGVNVCLFTEIAANHWLVSRRSAS